MIFNSLNFFKLVAILSFFSLGLILIQDGFKILISDQKKIIKNTQNSFKSTIKISTNIPKKVDSILQGKNLEKIKIKDSIISKNIEYNETILIVKKNDTFSKLIDPFFDNKIKNKIINKIGEKINLKNLNINQKIFLYENNEKNIVKIVLPKNFQEDLVIDIEFDKVFIEEKIIKVDKEINSLRFTIQSSLYEDGVKAGIPLKILSDVIRLYSFDIDFQRDIRKNTIFEVSYESLHNYVRKETQYGDIQYINLKILDQDLEYFVFKTSEGFLDYFNREGKNIKKSILKTPINGARLSSNFGMRKHPISGFNKLHKGVDFAAPKGTPVYAGGNGVIEFLAKNGGYGNYIRIRHNNEYKTAYAHLSKFKKSISKGSRVIQGEIIAYVGSTGNSTGPHLHYEIIYRNKQINPMKLKLPSGKVLKGKELQRFNLETKDVYAQYLFELYE